MELGFYPIIRIPQHPLSLSPEQYVVTTRCRHCINAAAVEGKGEQTDFPSPPSLNPVTAVGRRRAVLGFQRKETGKGPVAGLSKGGKILSVGKVPVITLGRSWGRR